MKTTVTYDAQIENHLEIYDEKTAKEFCCKYK